jgi:glycosyltransferase involved in cell wall biosynthesis
MADILFVYNSLEKFVKIDLDILKTAHNITTLKADKNIVKYFIESFVKVINSDIIFIWFAGWHSLFPLMFGKALGKKSILVSGGYDCIGIKKEKYGVYTSFWRGCISTWCFRNSDYIFAISKSSRYLIRKNAKCNSRVMYLGIDMNRFVPKGKKEDLVITVSKMTDMHIKRNGLRTFIESAKYLPNIRFMIIGGNSVMKTREDSTPLGELPSNVVFKSVLSQKTLLKYYQKAKVYAQLSFHSGFGMAMTEAMACGCNIVTTKRYALAEVAGNIGFYVPYGDVKKTVTKIKDALKKGNPHDNVMNAKRFDIGLRESQLTKAIDLIEKG